jgi:hypothetical protein
MARFGGIEQYQAAADTSLPAARNQRLDRPRAHISPAAFIRPENAADFHYLPTPDRDVHFLLRGDFILGDAIPGLIKLAGYPAELDLVTLSLSPRNMEMLLALLQRGVVSRCRLVVSTFFVNADKAGTMPASLEARARFGPCAFSRICSVSCSVNGHLRCGRSATCAPTDLIHRRRANWRR